MCHRMQLGSVAYPVSYFKSTTCRLIVRMPQSFVEDGVLTWSAVLSHLELWAEIEWKVRHGDDFSGQKTLNSADPALKFLPTNADRTLAYLYTGEFFNVPTCRAYKNNLPPPGKVAESPSTRSPSPPTRLPPRPQSSSGHNPPSPARRGAPPAHSSPNVTTKEQAQQACVIKYQSMLTENPAAIKAALDGAHEELHKYNGVGGLQASSKGPHVKVLVDAGLGRSSTTSEEPGSVTTGGGGSRAYFVPTWKPSKQKRKAVVEHSDDDY